MATKKKIYAIRRFIYLFLFALLFYFLSSGSVQAEVTLDGTLGPSGSISGPDYQITADLGQQVGANLFHSFGKFNVNTGEGAIFSGPGSISNIISRVTGGTSSWIDGYLRSDITGANLYLINPSGVMFGPNASLDISGSFHVSTADYLKLGQDGWYYATTPENSVLTSAPPTAFGFLGNNPGGISIQESVLEVPTGETLSVVGGDIEITGGIPGYLFAENGKIFIVSSASAGEFIPDSKTATFSRGGDINIHNAGFISTSGDPAGTVCIRGGNFAIDDSKIFSSSFGSLDGGLIDLRLTGDMNLSNGSVIGASAWTGDGADIVIEAQDVRLSGGSRIYTDASDTGEAGDIELRVRNLDITDNGSMISSATFWTGGSGDLDVTAENSISISGDHTTRLSSDAFGLEFVWPDGDAGDITVNAPFLMVDGGWISSYTGIWSSGDAGDISVNVGRLEIRNEGQITSSAALLGEGGNITVRASESILISDFFSSIDTGTSGIGNAGLISIFTPSLTLMDGGIVRAITTNDGDAGDIFVETEQLRLIDGGQINVEAETFSGGIGQGGNVTVKATDEISMSNQSEDPSFISGISTTTFGIGDGGGISVTAPTVTMDDGRIQAITFGDGNAGDVFVDVERLELGNGSQIDASVSSLGTGIGQGGNIQVNASDSISIYGRSQRISDLSSGITVQTSGSGDAGMINISTPNLSIDDGLIRALTSSTGDAGSITIDVGSLTLTGGGQIDSTTRAEGRGGHLIVSASDSVSISGLDEAGEAVSGLFSGAFGSGDAGTVSVFTPNLTMDQGRIRAETRGEGSAGTIDLDLDTMTLTGGAQIDGTSRAEGMGGSINVFASDFISIAGVDEEGYASGLLTDATASGLGGDIIVQTQRTDLSNGGIISAKSSGTANAGNITIQAADSIRLLNDSNITTETLQSDGGNIEIKASDLIYLFNSGITTSVQGGLGNGGNITIDPRFVILNNSSIIANAYGGNGGNIDIVSDYFIASADSIVQASSQLGISGTINITAPDIDLSGSLTVLPSNYLDATSLLRDRCEAMSEENTSSLVIEGRGGMPIEPDDYLPSP